MRVSRPADTERLVFRSWRQEDFALAQALWGDARVTALIDARGALDEGAVRARLEVELESERAHGIQYWPIFTCDGEELVGCCGLRLRDQGRGIMELGFHIRSEHWGKASRPKPRAPSSRTRSSR